MQNESGMSRWYGLVIVLALCVSGLNDAVAERRSERPNVAPVIVGAPPTSIAVGQPYTFRARASDADGDRLWFWVRNPPRWASFDRRTGELRGTPTQTGSHPDIVIGVSDWGSSAELPPFTLVVEANAAATDQPPVIGGSPQTTTVTGDAYVFQPSASDPEGSRLSFAVERRPTWASFDAATGRLAGTPTDAQVGSYGDIVISVTDGLSFASLAPFAIEVTAAPNIPPSISGSPSTSVIAGQSYAFVPAASDADGDRLTFGVTGKPVWASFDAATGRLSGTPGTNHVGTTSNIVISVSDGQASAALPAFDIEVAAIPNRAPTITGTPATSVSSGQPYSFAPAATDPDGDVLLFSIQNRPAWATFTSSTGRLAGTPGSTHVGSYPNIVISVSDGVVSSAQPAFGIEVLAAPNRAPVLSGAPATTARADEPYSFAPSASDPDGDRLTFSIAGKPVWASFDATTGRLSGTPGSAHVGSYTGIVISASDGKATTSLPPFSIRVEPPPQRSVTLSWQAPTMNEDGTPLTDLTGYEVHYGEATGQYTRTLSLPSATLTSVTIEDLAPATWYFAVKAVNSTGVQSSFSNEAWKTIN